VIASGDGANFKGPAKLAELERRYGRGNFDYIGDATADLSIWKSARRAYVVSCRGVLRKAQAVCTPHRVFAANTGIKPVIRALRPHQWVKNLLLFIPLILAHEVRDVHRLTAAVFAFWSFSLCASAIYIINDLLDLESDRRHPSKRNRPFAAGKLSAGFGLAMSGGLLVGAFSLAFALPSLEPRTFTPAWQFAALLAVYLALTTAYSFWLKRKLLVDVILLAGLYTHRIIAGAAAVDVRLTMWLLAFSMFFFLSLAFAKRYSELIQVEDAGEEHISGRAYQVRDLRVIESIGPSSGYLAVLVFCNYLDSKEMTGLYAHPQMLWLVAPILLYWITRIWFIARRRQLHDDPIIFAIRDRKSHVCGIMAALIVMVASIHWHSMFHR
jgi:4-hydroxybenzoate polyprenyltransferase